MRNIYTIRPRRLYVLWGVDSGVRSWEASAALCVLGVLFGVGWGYDDEMPVRPWPALSTRPHRGVPKVVLVWCGFFIFGAWIAQCWPWRSR